MSIMNFFVNDISGRISAEASRLARYNKRSTITSRKIQTPVRLLLPGELAKHAVTSAPRPSPSTPQANKPFVGDAQQLWPFSGPPTSLKVGNCSGGSVDLTAIPDRPVVRAEQAPYTSPMLKHQFNIVAFQ
ncbi:hypothetical protein RRG08_031078 [Elysia crispata]|uniref:Core Histone H2A/H2B/H3 domain-containing protein n=1 Tax=Elysia crispata TaxID=231223 RepID=A0AAE1DF59_9GAST|nr:hypothetical protein RRG08_031078 [Elysia crispata]